jgi:glucokinase
MSKHSNPQPMAVARQFNSQTIMDIIIHHGPVTRVDMARRAGISKQTVSEVVRVLEGAGWIHETGRIVGGVGRTAATFNLNPAAGYVLAVDLGGTKLSVAIGDLAGKIVAETQQKTDPRGGRFVIGDIVQQCKRVASKAHIDWSRVLQIAVGSPGVVNSTTGAVDLAPNIPTWESLAIERELRDALSVPVILENDVDLAARGEQWQGKGRGRANFIFVAIGTGVGMGIVVDGKICRGARGAAGEIAYMPLGGDPLDPALRERGVFEESVSGKAILRRYEAAGGRGMKGVPELFGAAATNDVVAAEVLSETARLVAMAAATFAAILDPELMVLGGGIGSRPELRESVRGWLTKIMDRPLLVETSLLETRASLIGALALALQRAHESVFAARDSPEPLTLPSFAPGEASSYTSTVD